MYKRQMADSEPVEEFTDQLKEEYENVVSSGNIYHFTITSATDEVSAALAQGTTDIAAVPANLASVLYNNTEGGVQVLAINTLGVLYIVESGDTVHSVAVSYTHLLQEEGHSSFEPCPSVMLQWRTAELLDKDCRQFAQVFIAYLLRGFRHP